MIKWWGGGLSLLKGGSEKKRGSHACTQQSGADHDPSSGDKRFPSINEIEPS